MGVACICVSSTTEEIRWKESDEREIEKEREKEGGGSEGKRDGDATRRKIVVPSPSLVNNAN